MPGGSFDYPTVGGEVIVGADLSTFYLDKYETTVGRFRAWVDAGAPLPTANAPVQHDAAGRPIRWDTYAQQWAQRPARLAGWRRYDTWAAGLSRAPKNNINWYTALAFCHWDGGRLPTEMEWTYAVVGGDQARAYPWGAEHPSYDRAVYNCHGDGHGACSLADLLPVGSRPRGAGRWGHQDLVGSVFEWTAADHHDAWFSEHVTARGGGFCYIGGIDSRAPRGLNARTARHDAPATISHTNGVRCAYDEPAPSR